MKLQLRDNDYNVIPVMVREQDLRRASETYLRKCTERDFRHNHYIDRNAQESNCYDGQIFFGSMNSRGEIPVERSCEYHPSYL